MSAINGLPANLIGEFNRKTEGVSKETAIQVALDFIKAHASELDAHARYAVFKWTVNNEVVEATERFREFEIIDPKYRYKSAKIVALKDSFVAIEYLEIFGLKTHNKVRKIAYLAFIKKGESLRISVKKIGNFGLDDNDRLNIALKMAEIDGPLVIEHFPYFNLNHIRDGRLFNIAKAAFAQNLRCSSKYIGNIPHLSEQERFELLMMRLAGDADKGLELTTKFGISAPSLKFQAAGRCAEYDGWQFSQGVPKWNFEEEEVRFQLAMKALHCKNPPTPEGALSFILNYKLTPQHVFEVFSEAISMKVPCLHTYLDGSGLDPALKYKLGLKFAVLNPRVFTEEMAQWHFSDSEERFLRELAAQAL